MKYNKFRIKNYKSISDEIEIDLSKKSLIPIIGVNECGKTTLLNAICAFDYYNDSLDDKIKHLSDVKNLYKINNLPAEITAEIFIEKDDLKLIIKEYYDALSEEELKDRRKKIVLDKDFDSTVIITRIVESRNKSHYKLIAPKLLLNEDEHDDICLEIIDNMPFILYFDDFRDSFPEEIEIPLSPTEKGKSEWVDHIEVLFSQTNSEYSLYSLPKHEERQIKSILSDVSGFLNKTLTKEWSNFRLDDKDALSISITTGHKKTKQFVPSNQVQNNAEPLPDKMTIKFEIKERDINGNERYFYVRDRSKGFYWFFNFVLKLEFNPKQNGSDYNAIYLLDEPGSYLHPNAQSKLCKKLKELSGENKVLYCTHSHYLLNPSLIPLNSIQIANKNHNNEIEITPFYDFKNSDNTIENSFQTIYDALEVKPFLLDISKSKVLLVEGIYDYYSICLFNQNQDLHIIPGKSASSLINLISIMIGLKIDFKSLWDNDEEGNQYYNNAINYFGIEQAENAFYTLGLAINSKIKIMQDLFDGSDLVLIRSELRLSPRTSFEKTISALYFSEARNTILKMISKKTRENFERLLSIFNR